MEKVKLVFTDTKQGVRAYCPKCNHFTLEPNGQTVKCENCGYESDVSNFEIRHEKAHGDRALPPLQTLNGNGKAHTPPPPELDDEPYEIPELDTYANIDFTFDETLVPKNLFREVYDYFKHQADASPQFIFTATLSAFMGIIGTRLSLTCGTTKIKPNDYFTLLTKSGNGKSTSLEACRGVLNALEKKIIEKPYHNEILFPQSSTLRGLLDCMRDESENELHSREALEQKGKPAPPPKVAQRSGVAIIDEVSSLFDATRNDFNTGLDATLLQLWDGNPRMIATSAKNDGKMNFGDSALTILSASTPQKFVERLPKGAMLDGMIPRFQFVFAENRTRPRKALTSLLNTKANHDAIADKLLLFFQFICNMAKHDVIVSDDAKALDEQSAQKWFDENSRLKDETADGYMSRMEVRKIRYALVFSALESYEQYGQFADAITISGPAMERAIKVCEFYKKHTFHFIVKAKAIKPKAPNQNEPLSQRIKNKLIELDGTADVRTLQRALTLKKEHLTVGLNELIATKEVILVKEKAKNGRLVEVVSIPKKSENGSDTSDTSDTSQKLPNFAQNRQKQCQKNSVRNYSDTVSENSPEITPEPTESEAAAAKAEPPVETLISLVLSELPHEVFTRETILSALEKHCGNHANEIGKLLFPAHLLRLGETDLFIHRDKDKRPNGYRELVDTNGVISANPLPAPFSDTPEPPAPKASRIAVSRVFIENGTNGTNGTAHVPPVPPVPNAKTLNEAAMPKPAPPPFAQKLVSRVEKRLKKGWSEKRVPYEVIRRTLKEVCGPNANRIERLLIPEKLVRIGKTDVFVFREDKHRPLLYRGLNEYAGIIEEIPALF